MEYTKEQVIEKIEKAFKECCEKYKKSEVLVNNLIQQASFTKEEKAKIFELFDVEKWADVISNLEVFEVFIPNGKKDKAVRIKQSEQNSNSNNTKTEEKKMTEQVKNHDRIQTLINALNTGLYEKEEAMRLAVLTAIAGESIFFLGAPGCAKSMIARRVAKAFKSDGDNPIKYFETLLNQFSTPEEVYGNISLKALNGELEDENGNKKEEYRRLTENMLPEADIAFLDEIWKASPAILNTLLTIVNERKFHNGSKVMDVPLKALFAASNELPAKNRGLEALYDRLIIRFCVNFISDEDNFFEMVDEPSASNFELTDEIKQIQISNSELKAWKSEIDEVILSEDAKAVISAIRKELTLQNVALSEKDKNKGELFEIGDRRWKKIVRILKTSAFLNDRSEVDLMDCQLIEYCIWSTEEQHKKACEIVEKCIKQNGLDCDTAIDEINEQIEEFKTTVDETWFKEIKKQKTDKIAVVDGQQCYVCTRTNTKETWYVSINRGIHSPWNDYHDIYNSNKEYNTNSSYQRDGDTIYCNYTFTVNKNPVQSYLEQKEFSNITQETRQKNFDKEHYIPIVDAINEEITALKTKKEKDAKPFKANLFANQEYNQSLTAKLDDAIHTLEDAKVNLDKQHLRYFNSELTAEYSIGDIILKNGIVLSSEELEAMTEEQKDNMIAIVCITGEKVFALGIIDKKMDWNAIKEFASHYGDNLPQEYSSGWIIPNKETLNAMWENSDIINEVLEKIGKNEAMLQSCEYWSSTEKDNSVAFSQFFDDEGKQDHTTKDHTYAVRAIREWSKK